MVGVPQGAAQARGVGEHSAQSQQQLKIPSVHKHVSTMCRTMLHAWAELSLNSFNHGRNLGGGGG